MNIPPCLCMLSQRAIVKRISEFCEISEEAEKRGGFLAPFELIGHSFVDEFLLHPRRVPWIQVEVTTNGGLRAPFPPTEMVGSSFFHNFRPPRKPVRAVFFDDCESEKRDTSVSGSCASPDGSWSSSGQTMALLMERNRVLVVNSWWR